MPLEDPTRIDIITRGEDGTVNLVITDSGLTVDPDERFAMLERKIHAYQQYILSDEFQKNFSGVVSEKVRILVLCAVPPTERMAALTGIEITGHNGQRVAIDYQEFSGATREETPPVHTNAHGSSWARGNWKLMLSRWLWRIVLCGLLASAVYRVVALKQLPVLPLLLVLMLWRARQAARRRLWKRMEAELLQSRIGS